jgi:hypothetical protein
LPATKYFRLAAGLGFAAMLGTSRTYTDDCLRQDNSRGVSYVADFSSGDQKIHSLFTLGIGGDFLVGL